MRAVTSQLESTLRESAAPGSFSEEELQGLPDRCEDILLPSSRPALHSPEPHDCRCAARSRSAAGSHFEHGKSSRPRADSYGEHAPQASSSVPTTTSTATAEWTGSSPRSSASSMPRAPMCHAPAPSAPAPKRSGSPPRSSPGSASRGRPLTTSITAHLEVDCHEVRATTSASVEALVRSGLVQPFMSAHATRKPSRGLLP